MKPNIFNLATKELSQDAFLAWLLQYADDSQKDSDENLNKCGKAFATALIQSRLPSFQEKIKNVTAGRQWENIDVWAKVNDKYLIVIEDKIHTSHHSNQLARYQETASAWCLENNYVAPICVYIKTGNESNDSLKRIVEQGFSVFNRKNILFTLDKHSDIQNNIFADFRERLSFMELANNQFENKKIFEWSGEDWQGFFQYLEDKKVLINWHFVNNPTGGFWNGLLNWDYWGLYPAYIQLEEGKLCFKISTDPDELTMPDGVTRSDIRNELHSLVVTKGKERGLNNIRRPNRFGNGKYMTVAVVDRENWLGPDDSLVDKESVINTLNLYKGFIKGIAK